MSNFKLKHQRKSGLFNKDEGITEGITPGVKIEKLPVFEDYVPAVKKMKIAKPAPFFDPMSMPPTTGLQEQKKIINPPPQKGYKQVFKTPEEMGYVPGDIKYNSVPIPVDPGEPADQWGNTDPRAKNMALTIAKHKRQEEEAARRRAEQLYIQEMRRKSDEAMQNMLSQIKKPQIAEEPAVNMLKRNSAAPFKLPHQSNTALKQNERELSQKDRDSLHDQANKFGKPFFSSEFGVNVDPEDGVLSIRPTFMPDLDDFSKLPVEKRGGYTPEELENLYPLSEGRKLTYDVEDKPVEDLAREAYAKRRAEYMSMVGKKKHPMLPAQTEDEALKEFFAESYSTKFNPETREIEDLVSSSGDGAISEEELAKVPSYLRNPFKQ